MSGGFDEVIHQPVRLRIMAAITAKQSMEAVEFTWLKRILGVTDGNLGAHLLTLEKAGYVEIEKAFVDRRPCTRVKPTLSGRRAFAHHVAALEAILHGDCAQDGGGSGL